MVEDALLCPNPCREARLQASKNDRPTPRGLGVRIEHEGNQSTGKMEVLFVGRTPSSRLSRGPAAGREPLQSDEMAFHRALPGRAGDGCRGSDQPASGLL